jgi:hypothetical protein
MVRIRTECCHGFTALTVILITHFKLRLFACLAMKPSTVAATLRADADGVGVGAKAFLQLPQFHLHGRSELLDIWCVPAPERLAQ